MRAAAIALALEASAVAEPASAPAADPPADPSVLDAADANLESQAARRGTNATLALGGGLTIGFGVDDATGNGGAGSLRLGHAATDRTVLTVELATVVLLHRVAGTEMSGELLRNEDVNLMLGAQLYINRNLWIRGALGFGVYNGRGVSDGMGGIGDITLRGPAGLIGGGIDFVRAGRVSVGAELMSIGMLNRDGLLSTGGLLVNLTIE